MAAVLFPKTVPNARTLSYLLDNERDYILTKRGQLILEPGNSQMIIPAIYEKTMAAFLWRDSAIRFVLSYAGELKIPSTLTDNLTMVLWYMDEVFNSTIRELKASAAMDLDLRSPTFDEYLTIEYWIGRHEPTIVNAAQVGPDYDINHNDWDSHSSSLGPIWYGKKNKFVLSLEERTLENAEVLLFEMQRFYNPPVQGDSVDDKLTKPNEEVENDKGVQNDVSVSETKTAKCRVNNEYQKERKREMRRQRREEKERERIIEMQNRKISEDEWYISEVEDEENLRWRDYDALS